MVRHFRAKRSWRWRAPGGQLAPAAMCLLRKAMRRRSCDLPGILILLRGLPAGALPGLARFMVHIHGAIWREDGARRPHGLTKTRFAGLRTPRNQIEDKQVLAASRTKRTRGWRITCLQRVPALYLWSGSCGVCKLKTRPGGYLAIDRQCRGEENCSSALARIGYFGSIP